MRPNRQRFSNDGPNTVSKTLSVVIQAPPTAQPFSSSAHAGQLTKLRPLVGGDPNGLDFSFLPTSQPANGRVYFARDNNGQTFAYYKSAVSNTATISITVAGGTLRKTLDNGKPRTSWQFQKIYWSR